MINTDELTVDHFFDPSSKNFIDDPKPIIEKLVKEYPIARFNAWSAWLVTGNKNITDCLLDRRLSTDFNLWEYAPPKKELEAMPEVYAILDDVKKKELSEDNVFEFTNQILDTTQDEVSKKDDKKESLFKDGDDAISWDDI